MTSSLLNARLSMALAMITVGSTIVASKLMAEMPVFIAAFIRFLIASPVLLMLARCAGQRLPRLRWRGWLLLCAQAGLGSVAYAVLMMLAMPLTSAADASVIAGALPAVAALLSVLLLRERLGGAGMLAIALACLGVWVLSAGGAQPAGQHWAGNALVLAAVSCEAMFLLLNKRMTTPLPPLLMAALMALLSLALCAVPALYQWRHSAAPVLQAGAVGATVYYALVPTVAGFYLWYRGAAQVSGAEASLFTAVYPVAGLLLSAAVLGETVTARHWTGIAISVAGIVIGARAPARSGPARSDG